jgi:hypothetical protein
MKFHILAIIKNLISKKGVASFTAPSVIPTYNTLSIILNVKEFFIIGSLQKFITKNPKNPSYILRMRLRNVNHQV